MIKATVGELVSVEVGAASGTGYRWQQADELPDGLELVDARFVGPPGAPGGRGTQHFVFKATRRGDYSVAFLLKRSWEAKPVDTKTVEIEVR